MRPVRTFLRSYRGTHPLGCSGPSLLRCGEHPRGYPDVAAGRCTGSPWQCLGARRGGVRPRLAGWDGTPHVSSAPTQGHPSPGRSALSLLRCGERPCDTLRALPENTAHQPKHPATTQQAKRRQPPPPHTQNAKPPSNTLKSDSLPRHSSLGTGRTQNHRESTATPAKPQRTPNTDTRRGAYILCRDIRVSSQSSDTLRGRVPCRSKEDNMHLARQNCIYSGNAKIPPIPKNQRDLS